MERMVMVIASEVANVPNIIKTMAMMSWMGSSLSLSRMLTGHFGAIAYCILRGDDEEVDVEVEIGRE